jgi:hypothetical protein
MAANSLREHGYRDAHIEAQAGVESLATGCLDSVIESADQGLGARFALDQNGRRHDARAESSQSRS